METILILFGITAVILLLCFAFFGVKMIFKKNGEFKKGCSSADPYTGEKTFCHCSNKSVYSECKEGKKYNPLNINKELLEETK